MSGSAAVVGPDNLVTLHYRIATKVLGDLVSTFATHPATLQLGQGELAPALERCLIGLVPGVRRVFELEQGAAFGEHRPERVMDLPRTAFPDEVVVAPDMVLELPLPGGGGQHGRVRSLTESTVTVDFNHPLAGLPVCFEVEILGIL